ncbi:transposase, partial [Xanthomonas oryzae]
RSVTNTGNSSTPKTQMKPCNGCGLGVFQGRLQIAKRSELHTFKVMPKRWIVERSFAWLEKNRRLWKNCERRLNTSLQFIHLAFLALLLRRS